MNPLDPVPYVVCPTERLRELCMQRKWLTVGTREQWGKIRDVNLDPVRFQLRDVAVLIWICSDEDIPETHNSYTDILRILYAEQNAQKATRWKNAKNQPISPVGG